MRIGFFSVAHISFGGGYEQQIVRLAIELAKKHHEVTLITLSEKGTYNLAVLLSFLYLHPRFTFSELGKSKQELKKYKNIKMKYFSSFRELKKNIQEQEVIYAKNEVMDSVLLRLIKIKEKPKLICGVHTLLTYTNAKGIHAKLHNFIYSSILYKKILNFYDMYHCINKEQQIYLGTFFDKRKIVYIPNFVDIKITPKKIIKNKKIEIIFVGRLSLQKGTDTFLNIIDKLKEKSEFAHIKITICGAGVYENQIKYIASLYKNIVYVGFLSAKEMIPVYKRADLLCTTSRGEAFPVACLEALAYGIPIIGFKVAGVSDIISDTKNGFLVPNDNINSFVNKILLLYRYKVEDTKKYIEMSRFGQDVIKKQYTAEVLAKKYQELFAYAKTAKK